MWLAQLKFWAPPQIKAKLELEPLKKISGPSWAEN